MADFYALALSQMDLARTEKIRGAVNRRDAFYAAHPELNTMETSVAAVTRDCTRRVLRHEITAEQAAEEARSRISALRQAHNARLADMGVSEQDFLPVWDCPLCEDTGYVTLSDGNRRVCTCLRRLAAELTIHANDLLPDPTQCFSRFDLIRFPGEPDPVPGEKHSQRQLMEQVLGIARDYAASLKKEQAGNFLMTGTSGLGKTFLAHCIGNAAAEQGLNVCMLTAYRLSGMLREAYLGDETAQRTERALVDCELLILDDMGSEPQRRNIDIEGLFSILNERCIAHRATVVATNLSVTGLRDRYGERITSRLTADARILRLYGRDIRRI